LLLLRWMQPATAVPLRWQHVFVIGNVKGALSIALALGLPADVPMRGLLVDVAFGVTFVSLVAQVYILGRSLRWLGLTRMDPVADLLGEQQGRLIAARAARQELDVLQSSGLVPRAGYDVLRGAYQVAIASAERELRGLQERHLAQGARALLHTRRRLVDAERTALMAARRTGLVSEQTASRLLAEVDARLLSLERVLAGETEEDR
jgi:CPA1 family monovalent cation:H+ antiporter